MSQTLTAAAIAKAEDFHPGQCVRANDGEHDFGQVLSICIEKQLVNVRFIANGSTPVPCKPNRIRPA